MVVVVVAVYVILRNYVKYARALGIIVSQQLIVCGQRKIYNSVENSTLHLDVQSQLNQRRPYYDIYENFSSSTCI